MPRIDRGVFISGDSPGGVAFCIRLARFQRSSPAKRSDITLVAGSQAWFRHGSSKPASRDGRQKETSKEAKLSERKLRNAQEIKKKAPELVEKVRNGELTLVEAKKLAALRMSFFFSISDALL